jgi:hypothetical protein
MATEPKTAAMPVSDTEEAQFDQFLIGPTPPIIEESIQAYRNDLPEMLEKHRGRWVVYHRGQRIGFASSQWKLIQKCVKLGIPVNDALICGVVEDAFDPESEVEFFPDV